MPTTASLRMARVAAARSSLRSLVATLPRAWHLLSLDAPTVAATWCFAFLNAGGARTAPESARSPVVFLSLATWLCYVGDRTLDARASLSPSRLRNRHRFYGALWKSHRRWLLAAVGCAAVACSATAVYGVAASLFGAYAVLTAVALLYFAWVHCAAGRKELVLAKEAAVGLIFAIGCSLPALDAAPLAERARLIPPASLFAVLCWLNCVAIERWEGRDTLPAQAHWSTHWAARHLALLLGVAALAAAVLALLTRQEGTGKLAPCLALAFVLLAILERLRNLLSIGALRILADIALLTPMAWCLAAGGPR